MIASFKKLKISVHFKKYVLEIYVSQIKIYTKANKGIGLTVPLARSTRQAY